MEEWGFEVGDLVELKGLSKLEINGQRGTILPLESPDQAKAMGRLAVMLEASGKKLSLKVENLCKASPAQVAKTGGDLGEGWSAFLHEKGKSAALSLREASKSMPEAAVQKLVVLGLSLRHVSAAPITGEASRQRLARLLSHGQHPDVLCVQEGIEGCKLLEEAGYTKVISSAVKAQTVREMLYSNNEALQAIPTTSTEKLLVNELYTCGAESDWQVDETGVEQISSDMALSGSNTAEGSLAARSVVWARLRPRTSPEGPFVVVLNAQLTGGHLEDQFFLQDLAVERQRQVERILDLFDNRAQGGDLGLLFGVQAALAPTNTQVGYLQDTLACYFDEHVLRSNKVQEDANTTKVRSAEDLRQRFFEYAHGGPSKTLATRDWQLLGQHDQQSGNAPDNRPGTSPCCMVASRTVPAVMESVPIGGLWADQSDEDCSAIRASIRVAQGPEARGLQQAGIVEMPIIGFGTCCMPEDLKERVPDQDFRHRVDDMTEAAVLAALEAGVRLFESANRHMNQQALGRTLWRAVAAGVVRREELFLVGRVSRCKDRGELRREVEMLLRELAVECVDLLVLETPPERVPGMWCWAEEVYREGRARYLGVSNFDLLGPKVCTELFRDFIASAHVIPAVYAMEVHPFNSNEEMADCCRSLGIRVLAYSPLGAPHKIESFMKVLTKSDARDMRPVLKVPDNKILQEVGSRHGVSAAQVALRWNLQRGHCVVPKSFDPAHIRENTELFGFRLSRQEMAILADLHKGVRAERFFQQAHVQGQKSLPRMTRDAQDICEGILSKIRGPGSAGLQPGATSEQRMQALLADHWRDQEVVKGKGKVGGPPALKGASKGAWVKGGPPPFDGKGQVFQGTGPPMLGGSYPA